MRVEAELRRDEDVGKLQLGLRSVKPKKRHGLWNAKWKQMNESGRLKLGPSVKL
jgi:hypothetical protein